MLIFALLILALPTSAGPRSVKFALLDARDVKAASQKAAPTPARKTLDMTLPAHLTMVDAPPPALTAFLTPSTNVPETLTLTAPETLRLFWIQNSGSNSVPGLYRDHEFYHVTGKGQFLGLWDVSAGIHADIHLGNLFFDNEEASLRVIPIHTTSTKLPGGVQPGFVIGLGTTW
jgi:hypothetical protein